MPIQYYLLLGLIVAPQTVKAETERPGYLPPSSVVPTEEMLKMVVGLLAVLAVIGAITWILKRLSLHTSTTSDAIKIVSSVSVGQRERLVLVEIEDIRLLIGVAPGHINTLHCFNKENTKTTCRTNPEQKPGKSQNKPRQPD